MKKIALAVQSKDAKTTVEQLRKLGVLHVEHTNVPQGSELAAITDGILLINHALGALLAVSSKAKQDTLSSDFFDWKKIALQIVDLKKRQEQLKEYSVTLQANIDKWKSWGDFEPNDILALRKKNIYFGFYQIPEKYIDSLPKNYLIKKISKYGNMINCVICSLEAINIPYKEIELPKMSGSAMQNRLCEDKKVMALIHLELEKHIVYYQELRYAKKELENKLEFYNTLRGMGEEEKFAYIKGYIPEDAQDILINSAKSNKWALSIKDLLPEEEAPVLIRNPKWVSIISPVFKLLEVMPGYRELDVSLFFLIFFSVFFGILIGDAGYGLTYLLLTVWFHKKKGFNKSNLAVFLLFYLLSSCAIIWGMLTASFFGQTWVANFGIKPLAPALNNSLTMQTVCFFIGALHLSLAHFWRAILKFPGLSAIADIGWICILWSAFFIARTLILAQPYPQHITTLLFAGIALVIFFSSPNKNIFKAMGNGLNSVCFGLNFM
ncbi:MAG: hypothetical protein AAB740_03305, partial [Patescibacteria group bacterium]